MLTRTAIIEHLIKTMTIAAARHAYHRPELKQVLDLLDSNNRYQYAATFEIPSVYFVSTKGWPPTQQEN